MTFLAGRKPSAATVVAVGALVCAMSGTAVAANGLQKGDNLIKKHSLSGNRLRAHTVTAGQLKQPIWHTMTLLNGWAPYDVATYGPPAYAIDDQGFVHLRGAIKGDTSTADSFAQLPPGFRPAEPDVFVPAASTNGPSGPQAVVLDVQHSGFITAEHGPGGSFSFVSLAGISVPRS
jgi:hypothetical protein